MLSKEQAVIFPGLLLAMDWLLWKKRRLGHWPWKEYALHLVILGLYLGLRWAVLGRWGVPRIDPIDNPLAGMPFLLRLENALAVLCRYGTLLLFPHPLSADYSYSALPLARSLFSLQWGAGLIVLCAAFLAARCFVRAPAPWSLGAVWAGAALASVANIAMPIGTIMGERLLYLPDLGFALAAGVLLESAWQGTEKRLVRAGLIGVLLAWGGNAWTRSLDWRDNEHLFRAVLRAYPRSAKAQQGLGTELKERGDLIGAVERYRKAIEIYPEYAMAYYNLGIAYLELRQYEKARDGFQEAARLRPRDPKAWLDLGVAWYGLGRLEEAKAAYERAAQVGPGYGAAWQNLAEVCYELGEKEEAARAYEQLLRLEPDHPMRARFEARIREARQGKG